MTTNLNNGNPTKPCYTLDYIKSYLTDQITHWYNTHYPNRSTTGHVTSITTYGPNNEHLLIQYAENHDGGHPMYDIISECDILYYSFCTPDQIYTAWQNSL